MPPRPGRRTASPPGNVGGAGEPGLGQDVLERLVETLNMTAQPRYSVEQAMRLGVVSFVGTTNPEDALFWLSEIEKILDEGMQCPDAEKLRIADFLLGGEARNW